MSLLKGVRSSLVSGTVMKKVRFFRTVTLTGFPAGEIDDGRVSEPQQKTELDTSPKPLSDKYVFLKDQEHSKQRPLDGHQVMVSRRLSFEEQEALYNTRRQKYRLEMFSKKKMEQPN